MAASTTILVWTCVERRKGQDLRKELEVTDDLVGRKQETEGDTTEKRLERPAQF